MSEYPGLDAMATKLSALTTRIEALEFNSSAQVTHISPDTLVQTFADGTSDTYRKE